MNLKLSIVGLLLLSISSCTAPTLVDKTSLRPVPKQFIFAEDSANSVDIPWVQFFDDPYLSALIDTALDRNLELNQVLQEIIISKNEVRIRKGEYLPSVGLQAGMGVDKTPRYTPLGANEATTEIAPGEEMPEPVPDFKIGAVASWEIDIWNKLRSAKKAAALRYLASIEGKNFMMTQLVSEIAHLYYELLAEDNLLLIVKETIQIQQNALRIVRQQKAAGKVTELAVQKFQAEVFKNRSKQYYIEQKIITLENEINSLLGRFPQAIERSSQQIIALSTDDLAAGLPSQLIDNRPDVRQAVLALEAAKMDVKVAKANFYPSLGINAGLGLQAFNLGKLVKMPESIAFSAAGDLISPLVNRNAIKANYSSANAAQIQAVYQYQQTLLNAFVEVSNQLSARENLAKSYDLKNKEVKALQRSITISTDLFASARADYMEILLTQRDAQEARFELVETKMHQLNAQILLYKALGGGWK